MSEFILEKNERLELARQSLNGLATGDALGQRFFAPGNVGLIVSRKAPPPFWSYTDDTAMAISIVRTLQVHGCIDQEELAKRFATVFAGDPLRGYGPGARRLLADIAGGADWRVAAYEMFGGEGSMGNGGAMRVAPLGAYFADDLKKVVSEAKLSAEVTHAHPEGQAGTIAVALAAALAVRIDKRLINPEPSALFDVLIEHTPDGLTRMNLKQAAALPADTSLEDVVRTLGNGSRIISYDTVPFCLWCAFHNLDSYTDALWTCVSAGGDIDTTAAIVGGIVSLSAGPDAIPKEWTRARESYSLMNDG